MRRLRSPWAALAAAAAALAGCAVGPNYHRPQMPLDARFVNAGEPGFVEGDPIERYWNAFSDPLLTQLI
ncbi:MAG TPA: multidrug transporter, partial [Steroidobacteraceae bacterium]|nr:multidrug transporter [Steroidobacteraceae bacterium]